jgi:hypothetical protein
MKEIILLSLKQKSDTQFQLWEKQQLEKISEK